MPGMKSGTGAVTVLRICYLRRTGLAGYLVIAVLQVLGGAVLNNTLEERLRLADGGAGADGVGNNFCVKRFDYPVAVATSVTNRALPSCHRWPPHCRR
jgi:hypothetical protein